MRMTKIPQEMFLFIGIIELVLAKINQIGPVATWACKFEAMEEAVCWRLFKTTNSIKRRKCSRDQSQELNDWKSPHHSSRPKISWNKLLKMEKEARQVLITGISLWLNYIAKRIIKYLWLILRKISYLTSRSINIGSESNKLESSLYNIYKIFLK